MRLAFVRAMCNFDIDISNVPDNPASQYTAAYAGFT